MYSILISNCKIGIYSPCSRFLGSFWILINHITITWSILWFIKCLKLFFLILCLFVPPLWYSVPLEKGTSEVFRQREARAARLASEIESSPQYRHRVNLENDEGKSEEDKYSAVVRDSGDREKGRESPRDRDRERGRDSPGASNRWEAASIRYLHGRKLWLVWKS